MNVEEKINKAKEAVKNGDTDALLDLSIELLQESVLMLNRNQIDIKDRLTELEKGSK